MRPPRRINRNEINLDEFGNDGDFTGDSGDEWSPETDKSHNGIGDSTFEDTQSINTPDDADSTSDNLPFNTTAGFSLKIVKTYKSSKHPVWLMYGYLMKEDKAVNRVKDRFFCKKCFDKEKFKRYVHVQLWHD